MSFYLSVFSFFDDFEKINGNCMQPVSERAKKESREGVEPAQSKNWLGGNDVW